MAIKTHTELRAFMWGIAAGITILVFSFSFVSYFAGVKWQPVKAEWSNGR